MVGWVFFRADTLPQALQFLAALAGASRSQPSPYALAWFLTPELCLALVAGVIGSAPLVPALARWRERIAAARAPGALLPWALDAASTAALLLLFVTALMQVAARSYNPFIYFRF
jgi:alginate O-acetyltransferase complex protein AlgI